MSKQYLPKRRVSDQQPLDFGAAQPRTWATLPVSAAEAVGTSSDNESPVELPMVSPSQQQVHDQSKECVTPCQDGPGAGIRDCDQEHQPAAVPPSQQCHWQHWRIGSFQQRSLEPASVCEKQNDRRVFRSK